MKTVGTGQSMSLVRGTNGMSPYGKKRYYLNMPYEIAKQALDEWLWRDCPCNVTWRRSKIKGCSVVIVDADPEVNPEAIYWLNHIVINGHNEVKVHVEELKEPDEKASGTVAAAERRDDVSANRTQSAEKSNET